MEFMFLPLKRYADFSGRSRRMEFWMWVLFQFALGIAFSILMVAMGGMAMLSGDPTQMMAVGGVALVIYLLYLLVGLAFLIPNLAVTVRRLHDTNRSGHWIWLFWAPYLVMIASTFIIGQDVASGGDGMAGSAVVLIASLVLLVGSIVLLVFMFLEGTRGPNSYGPDPKGQDTSQVFA